MPGDELNIIRPGADYGWPSIAYGIEYSGEPVNGGKTAQEGMEQPVYYWDPSIAPSGIMFYTGTMFPGVEKQPVRSRPERDAPGPPGD